MKKMRGATLTTILVVASGLPVVGAAGPASSLEAEGFDHFYNLEYDQAIADFDKQIAAEPQNPNAYNHLAQAILYREMLRSGALESQLVTGSNPFIRRQKMNPGEPDRRRFEGLIAKAMQLGEARLEKNSRDTDALYALGVSYGLRANYSFLVHKAWLDALRYSATARNYHNQVTAIDPSSVDAQLLQGLYDYVVGSLPWAMKMLGFVGGFRGDREEGIRTLQLVAQKGHADRVDAQVLLAVIYRRERRPLDAIPLLNTLVHDYPRAYLLRFEQAQMYGDAGDEKHALEALDKVEEMKRAGVAGYARVPDEKIRYARGNLLFWYNDLDRALDDLKAVTAHADNLDLNTGVLAWMRLGQTYDLKGQRSNAKAAYRKAIAYAPQSDAAKESRGYLSSPYRRRAG
ncbi:MAG: tetratricopeptide repeat protein [Bryobacteraceae bacterium]